MHFRIAQLMKFILAHFNDFDGNNDDERNVDDGGGSNGGGWW